MLDIIREKLCEMRKSEIRVANYILEDPEDVLYLSLSELAQKTNTSDPTVMRFCRKLGLGGYHEFKIELARHLLPRYRTIHEAVDGVDDPASLLERVFKANADALSQALQVIDSKEVEKAIGVLDNAGRIEFYGLGASGIVAMDAYHKFFRLGISCIALTDPHMMSMSASLLKKGDVVFAISHSGASKDIVDALSVAKQAEATTIGLFGHSACPVAMLSDVKLFCHTKEHEYKPEAVISRIAQLSVLDTLSVGLALKRKDLALENLEKTRKALMNKKI